MYIWFLGKKHRLVIDNTKRRSVVKSDKEITIYSKNHLDAQDIRLMMEQWYFKQAEHIFSERLREMVKCFTGTKKPELRIKSQQLTV